MAQIKANGIQLEYETFGSADGTPLLLIRGLGTQLTAWPQDYLDAFVDAGYRVIIFDNRDVGLSEKFEAAGPADISAVVAALKDGVKPDVAYEARDMAADAVGLMDALGIEKAHVMGMSMGGMIVQILAATWPERFYSATSVMSSTGAPGLPRPTQEIARALVEVYDGEDLEGLIAFNARGSQLFTGKGRPMPFELIEAGQRRAIERCYYPEGVGRQYAAVVASGDRSDHCRSIRIPFLVLHGTEDPLIDQACGVDTAEKVPGAKLHLIEGMGHDLPPSVCEELTGVMIEFMRGCR